MNQLTKYKIYIKENLNACIGHDEMVVFSEKFPDEFLEVRENIENKIADVSELFDAMINKSLHDYSLDFTVSSIMTFREYVEYELALIEDIEELAEDESKLNRELHGREEARSINKELKQ